MTQETTTLELLLYDSEMGVKAQRDLDREACTLRRVEEESLELTTLPHLEHC